MFERISFTEYLALDLNDEHWYCRCCGHRLASARDNYKRGCLVAQRLPAEIHAPTVRGEYTFSPDPDWIRIVEFYCPGCLRQIETEYLPPGHPITHDIELDLDSLRTRVESGDLLIREGKLAVAKREGTV